MVHRNIDDIEIPFFIWKKIIKKDKVKLNLCFDTETIDGRVFVISDSNGRVVNESEFKNLTGLLQYLNTNEYRKTVNWFYNLEYDTNALLKFLSFSEREHIAHFGYVDYDGYRISIIPRKELRISRIKHDKISFSTIFYDLAQFYNFKRLADLAKTTEYNKIYVDDISHINAEKYYNNKEYNKLINDRCIIDCKITQVKANELTKNIQKVININSYKSNASIARKYVLSNLKHDLKLPTKTLLSKALQCYHAGHIETCQIGNFKNTHNYDIKSAYPSFIANLYETSGGYLHNREYEPETAYSYYNIQIDFENDYISPLWFKKSNNNYHTIGKHETWITKTELEYFINHGYDYHIIGAYHLKKDKYTEQPFYNIIHDLYNERLKAKDNKDEIELVFKIILNSIYGVTLNTIHKKILSEWETDMWEVINNKMVFYMSEFKATNMYNPIFGTDITAQTRAKLFTDFYKNYDKIISINTDGVFMSESVNHLNISNKLGDYGYKKLDEIMVMGSGRYFISDKGRINNDESKFRGISKRPEDIFMDMKANKNDNKLSVSREKPIKLKESLRNKKYYDFSVCKFPIQDYNLNDQFNVFNKVSKDIFFKTDKRYWYDEIGQINDLWDKQITSRPFNTLEL